jgi:uncharacterized repeat protein (TIGR03803 family)
MAKLNTWERTWAVILISGATAIAAPAQTLTTLVRFDFTHGAYPGNMSLVQGTDGNLYGTTSGGGAKGGGTIFKVTPSGSLTTLYSFCSQAGCTDGAGPYAGLVLASDGDFYGTTVSGGGGSCNNGCGTVFKITPKGTLTTIHTFDGLDGAGPCGALVQATDGFFYGTTSAGGANNLGTTYFCGALFEEPSASGTIFKINPGGTLTTLHSFDGSDGADPVAGLVQGADGNFYGTASAGGYYGDDSCGSGPGGCGTVFKITSGGTLTTLHSFNANIDGAAGPLGRLVEATDGNFYGTTLYGGCYDETCGAVFEITTGGALTTLIGFCRNNHCSSGSSPNAGLIQATDGNLYGTLPYAGPAGWDGGDVFEMTPGGGWDNPPYAFCSQVVFFFNGGYLCLDGANPIGGLLQATNGILYGTTSFGGQLGTAAVAQSAVGSDLGCGTVFSLDMNLGPFVAFVRDFGRVGQTGGILGQGFTGATSVSLNGVPASFTVISNTFIAATVPPGATTGFVTVTTPSGTLTSNQPFTVLP